MRGLRPQTNVVFPFPHHLLEFLFRILDRENSPYLGKHCLGAGPWKLYDHSVFTLHRCSQHILLNIYHTRSPWLCMFLLFVSMRAQLGTHGVSPHPLTYPPLRKSPGARDGWWELERRHSGGYTAINSAISQEIGAEFDSMLSWIFSGNNSPRTAASKPIAFNIVILDSWLITLCQLYKMYKWLTYRRDHFDHFNALSCSWLTLTHWPNWLQDEVL